MLGIGALTHQSGWGLGRESAGTTSAGTLRAHEMCSALKRRGVAWIEGVDAC